MKEMVKYTKTIDMIIQMDKLTLRDLGVILELFYDRIDDIGGLENMSHESKVALEKLHKLKMNEVKQ